LMYRMFPNLGVGARSNAIRLGPEFGSVGHVRPVRFRPSRSDVAENPVVTSNELSILGRARGALLSPPTANRPRGSVATTDHRSITKGFRWSGRRYRGARDGGPTRGISKGRQSLPERHGAEPCVSSEP